jgi:hypothetical protein
VLGLFPIKITLTKLKEHNCEAIGTITECGYSMWDVAGVRRQTEVCLLELMECRYGTMEHSRTNHIKCMGSQLQQTRSC